MKILKFLGIQSRHEYGLYCMVYTLWFPPENPLKDENDNHVTCLLDKWSGAGVIRPDDKSRSKYERDHYSVSKEEYDLDHYPTYCGGPCTLLTGSTMQKSYETAKVTNPGKFIMEGRHQYIQTKTILHYHSGVCHYLK